MASIRVERVFGGEPFCEIGRPVAAALSGDGGLLVVSGSFWWSDRLGIGFGQRSNPHPGWYPVGVYDAETLACLHLRHLDRAILRIDIHPTRPIAAAITRRGPQHAVESEVLILDLTTAALVSVAVVALDVHRVVWRDDETADLLVATAEGRFFWTVRRDDWHRPTPGMLGPPDPRPRVVRLDEPENVRFNETDRFVLDHWCRDRGIVRTQRTDVWGLEGLGDGRILAALWPVAAEVWSPDADGPVWRVALPESVRGLQVRVRGGRALALTQPFGAEDTQCLVHEFDLATGAELGRQLTDEGCLLVVRADGWWATRAVGGHSDGHVTVYDPAGARVGTAELGRFRSWAHGLDVRDAPDLLFVHGDDTETRVVVAVDPSGTVRRLFPVAWDGDVDADVRIGCGVYVDGTLVHAALRMEDGVLLPGNAVVVRREYPGGAPLWLFQADHQVTALDVADGRVFVALNTGDLFVLALEDGSVLGRTGLTVGGHRVLPWSLSRSGAGRVAIGTADGRVLDCAVT